MNTPSTDENVRHRKPAVATNKTQTLSWCEDDHRQNSLEEKGRKRKGEKNHLLLPNSEFSLLLFVVNHTTTKSSTSFM